MQELKLAFQTREAFSVVLDDGRKARGVGLDVSRRYRVTFDNSGQICEMDGFTLMKQGITVRLEGALTSELLLFEAL